MYNFAIIMQRTDTEWHRVKVKYVSPPFEGGVAAVQL
jgi:hypothetical protein